MRLTDLETGNVITIRNSRIDRVIKYETPEKLLDKKITEFLCFSFEKYVVGETLCFGEVLMDDGTSYLLDNNDLAAVEDFLATLGRETP